MTQKSPWGYNFLMEIKDCSLSIMQSKEKLQDYVIKLCKLIEMVRYGDCIIHGPFGDGDKKGLSLIQMIESSNITAHFSDEDRISYIDIFSCKSFDVHAVLEFTMNYFDSGDGVSHYLFRGLK